MGEICFNLAQKILAQKQQYDLIIALLKGGVTWSRTLLDYLGMEHLSIFQVKFYQNIKKTNKQPIIYQSLPVSIQGKNILLFDEVVDSGETLQFAQKYLEMCGAKKVSTAALCIKSWAKIKPDFFITETDAWIIFPHEIRETIKLLTGSWRKNKVNMAEINKRLCKLGLPKKQIKCYLK
ncbi:MAG: hypothetical protein M1426_00870 [Patescibacteria group bacterium]|nr:hypothetical protein [Patescibacteria group bacterium]